MDEQKSFSAQSSPVQFDPIAQAHKAETPKKNHVGFWPFVGLLILFSIPIIGLIAALIFLFASKNKTIKAFSGAHVTVAVTQAIVSALIFLLLLSLAFSAILPIVNNALGTDFDSVAGVVEAAINLMKGNYSEAAAPFVDGAAAILGEEYEPFLRELTSGKYEDLLHQLKNEQYSLVLSDLQNGKYEYLTKNLDPDAYDFLFKELEKSANGFDSELFDRLDDILP